MTDRARLEAELENLERMLSEWRGTLRHEAQFRQQFDALAKEILHKAEPADRAYAQDRLNGMLARHLPAQDNKTGTPASKPRTR
jgi:hypothetical protein